jgi:hypothetical protein
MLLLPLRPCFHYAPASTEPLLLLPPSFCSYFHYASAPASTYASASLPPMLPLLLPPMLPLLLPPVLRLLLPPIRITNRLPPDSRARRRTSFYYHAMPGLYQRHSRFKLSTFLYHSCYSLKNATSPRRYPFSIINKALAIPGRPIFTLQYKQPMHIPNEE